MKQKKIIFYTFAIILLAGCLNTTNEKTDYEKAVLTLNSVYNHYSIEGSFLLRENFPHNEKYTAGYLTDEEQSEKKKPYAYLWPYSGSLSAITALYEATKDTKHLDVLENKVLPGLEEYFDTIRFPNAYASYIYTTPLADRFYDDNVWIGLDFIDLYILTGNEKYINKAKTIWSFIESGTDTVLGGGIYWCEQKKTSKNTCSNAPGAVYAIKLFQVTGDITYLNQAIKLYEWTKKYLQDENDFLYFDNINLKGRINEVKYAYNSGQMMQASALLYKTTRQEKYLQEAQHIAHACYDYFFHDFHTATGETLRLLDKNDIWFTAIMLRGFIELYNIDHNEEYINAFQKNLDYAWTHMRDENGLFNSDWSGKEKDDSKWLLTQFAMVEMYARMNKL